MNDNSELINLKMSIKYDSAGNPIRKYFSNIDHFFNQN